MTASPTLHTGRPHGEQVAGPCVDVLKQYVQSLPKSLRRVLLVPPDITRIHSGAGWISAHLYQALTRRGVEVDLLPALGTHVPMTKDEATLMFGCDVPFEKIHAHRWREDCVVRGTVAESEMADLSRGLFRASVEVSMNRMLFEAAYDRIISIGQVVPHEVVGMAGYTKNICIGLGGPDVIHKSHFLGALCGIESIMGNVDTPVRRLLNALFERWRPAVPVDFVMTVVNTSTGAPIVEKIICGQGESSFREAAAASVALNCFNVGRRIQRAVVYLEPSEYRSTWLGNKAIYRLRKAMADDGELIILAPGLKMFGEDPAVDALIRRHGYRGTPHTLATVAAEPALNNALSVPAHLIHGSTEGRFRVIYATGLAMSGDTIRSVGYEHMPIEEAMKEYSPDRFTPGWNGAGEAAVYFVNNPGLGLWVAE